MAWSLSQIVAVGLPGSGTVFNEEVEHYTAFYDMFVNHSFGNYLDLMKEFSRNSIMGGWLSFKGNKSLQYNIDEEGKDSYPDENVSIVLVRYLQPCSKDVMVVSFLSFIIDAVCTSLLTWTVPRY